MRLAAAALLGVLAVASGCHPRPKERAAVRQWLLCEECSEGELAAVFVLGDRVLKPLDEALKGPPQSGRENIRLQTMAMYARIPSPLVPQAAYVEHYVDNYVATYQSRAAIALALIGSTRARAILLEAVRDDSATYREDVRNAIGSSARVSITAVDTTVQHAPVNSFVRIEPTVLVVQNPSYFGAQQPQPWANIQVVFVVESGGGTVLNPVQHTDANGAATIRWQLGPGVDSANVLRAETTAGVVRFRAIGSATRVSMTAVDTTAQSAPVNSFVRFEPRVLVVGDTSGSGAPQLQPLANFQVVFQVESGGGTVLNPVQRTDANGEASIRWQLGPGVDSANVLRAEAAGLTVRFRATGRGPDPRVVFAAQPANGTAGQPIDTVRVTVVDPWGERITNFSGFAVLTVVGIGDSLVRNLVGGADSILSPVVAGFAGFAGLRVSTADSGLRVRVRVPGANQGFSQRFDVVP